MEIAIITKDRQDRIPSVLFGLLSQGLWKQKLRIYDNGESPFSENNLASNIVDLLVNAYEWDITIQRQNLSLVDSRQRALEECKSEHLLFLDDDVFLMPGSIVALKSEMGAKMVAFTSPSFLDHKNAKGYSDWSLEVVSGDRDNIPQESRIYRRYEEKTISIITHFDNGCVLLDVEKAKYVGGYKNWDGFIIGEDTVLSRRLRKNLYIGKLCPEAIAYHFTGKSLLTDFMFRSLIHNKILSGEMDKFICVE